MSIGWMSQAPTFGQKDKLKPARNIPFALTHSAFRLGRASWSLLCSRLSGGSTKTRLLDLRLRRSVPAMVAVSEEEGERTGTGESPVKETVLVLLSMMGDSLTVVGGRNMNERRWRGGSDKAAITADS